MASRAPVVFKQRDYDGRESSMSSVTRFVFMGRWWLFALLVLSIVGVPLAILYLLNGTLMIRTEMDDPESFITQLQTGRLPARPPVAGGGAQ
jgi:hypothetical protein